MSPSLALLRNELRLLRHDPVPTAVLIGMPAVLMVLLSDAFEGLLADEGFVGASGAAQAVPGMACVFAYFGVAIVGLALFREHGWRTWPRLRVAGLEGHDLLVGKLTLPALLLAAQHVVLFGLGVALLDLDPNGSWVAIGLTAATYALMVLLAGLAVAAVVSTIQQLNAVTNLGAMVIGGLGGGFVPVDSLPDWLQPLAPISPTYWAMEAYESAILRRGDVADVAGDLLVLAGFAAAFGAIALWRLRLDAPKRTWA